MQWRCNGDDDEDDGDDDEDDGDDRQCQSVVMTMMIESAAV